MQNAYANSIVLKTTVLTLDRYRLEILVIHDFFLVFTGAHNCTEFENEYLMHEQL